MIGKILIFGGAGSLGTELTKFYLDHNTIICASRDEAKHFELKTKFNNHHNLKTYICDVREKNRVEAIILQERPNVIIIAQALKQIDLCEQSPEQSVQTNINGVINIAETIKNLHLCNIYTPQTICFVSTDKGCAPSSVYGMCKSISERIMLNLSRQFINTGTKIVITRYGNVLNSKGSVIPLFWKQAHNPDTQYFTLTNKLMTRFLMTLGMAVNLIDNAIKFGNNGDLFVPKLKSMKILDLIKYFSTKFNKPYKIIGIRGVEKLDEWMLTREEFLKAQDKSDYFIINDKNEISDIDRKEYSSADYLMSYEELEVYMNEFLKLNQI